MLILYRDGTILMIAGTNCLVARENPIAASAVLFGTEARMLAEWTAKIFEEATLSCSMTCHPLKRKVQGL